MISRDCEIATKNQDGAANPRENMCMRSLILLGNGLYSLCPDLRQSDPFFRAPPNLAEVQSERSERPTYGR